MIFFPSVRAGDQKCGGSPKVGSPSYFFIANLSFVAIYMLFQRLSMKFSLLSESFRQNSAFFLRTFNESHPAFIERATKVSLLSESSKRKLVCYNIFATLVSIDFLSMYRYRYMVNLNVLKSFSKIIKTACLLSRIRKKNVIVMTKMIFIIIISAMKMII